MKIIKGLINVLTTLIIVVGVVLLGLYVCGITPYVVLSGSMEPTIKTGSLSFINKHVKYENIKEKDIIAFKMDDKTLVTHRVVSITDEGFETKGDANEDKDGGVVTKNNYFGKNLFSIPVIGRAVKLVQSTTGKIVFGTLIVLLFMAGILLGEDKKKTKEGKELTLEIKESDVSKSKEK